MRDVTIVLFPTPSVFYDECRKFFAVVIPTVAYKKYADVPSHEFLVFGIWLLQREWLQPARSPC